MTVKQRKIISAIITLIAIVAVVEVAMYNWRLSLSLELEKHGKTARDLNREMEELVSLEAELLTPEKLMAAAESLGLEPLRLENFRIISLSDKPGGVIELASE